MNVFRITSVLLLVMVIAAFNVFVGNSAPTQLETNQPASIKPLTLGSDNGQPGSSVMGEEIPETIYLPVLMKLFPPEEPIMILEPGNGSRVVSPVRIFGFADSTFEQNLGIRIYLADGTLLTTSFTTIQAELGQRGPFEAEVEFDIEGEENAFIQVFSDSARDGGITHLNSVGVILAEAGDEDIVILEPYTQIIRIFTPGIGEEISGGVARVTGFGLASFEQTLVLEVQDEDGNVIATKSFMVMAPDLGIPGPFEAEVAYSVTHTQPGRLVVRDISPAFGGDTYLTSVEVQLSP
jgi:hypothetical protein